MHSYTLTFVLLSFYFAASAATYYVDYDEGDDSSSGTATNAPWQHCPGDANATGNAASATPTAGDTVQFKGGVRYYTAGITWNWSGATNNPITLKGTGWGDGKAILDCGSLFTNEWTQCTSADQVFGNTNYASIWFANSVSTQSSLHTVIVSNTFLPMAQDVNPSRPILFDVVTTWRTTASSNVTTTTLTGDFLTQDADGFWTGATLALHKLPNSVSMKAITGYDGTSKTITNDAHNNSSFYNPSPYSIIGHPFLIDSAGEYAVLTNRFFLWPPGGTDPNTLIIRLGSIADCAAAIMIAGESFVTVDGFEITGSYGGLGNTYYGGAIGNNGSSDYYGLKVLNCSASNCRSMTQGGVFGANLQNGNDFEFAGNSAIGCLRSRGSIFHGGNFTVNSNHWEDLGGTVIYFAGVATGTIHSNRLHCIRGTHGNGISVYQGSTDITVSANALTECGSPITYEYSTNVYFYNNVVDCTFGAINEWGYVGGEVRWINNTIVNHATHLSLNLDKSTSTATFELRNNIVDGVSWQHAEEGRIYRSHNIWVGCPTGYGCPEMLTGESTNSLALLLVNSTNDWRLLADSPAIGAGTNLNSYFTTDALGVTRGTTWDIGAYQRSTNVQPAGAHFDTIHILHLVVEGTL